MRPKPERYPFSMNPSVMLTMHPFSLYLTSLTNPFKKAYSSLNLKFLVLISCILLFDFRIKQSEYCPFLTQTFSNNLYPPWFPFIARIFSFRELFQLMIDPPIYLFWKKRLKDFIDSVIFEIFISSDILSYFLMKL